jgi:antitoxin PrlF
MKAKVAERGQVTIPKLLRERLGIRAGTVLDFEASEGRLIAVKVASADPVEQVYGCLRLPRGTDAIMQELRGKE